MKLAALIVVALLILAMIGITGPLSIIIGAILTYIVWRLLTS